MENIPNSLENLSPDFGSQRIAYQNSVACLFHCTQCLKNFSSKHCLAEHFYRHSKIKPYLCLICGKHLRHASQFSIHKKSHNGPQVSFYPNLSLLDRVELLRETEISSVEQKVETPLILGQTSCFLPKFISYFGII